MPTALSSKSVPSCWALTLLLLVTPSVGGAQTNITDRTCDGEDLSGQGCYVQVSRPDCYVWKPPWKSVSPDVLMPLSGLVQERSAVTWSGECSDGLVQGVGVIRWPMGTVWEGTFKDGKRHGHWTIRRWNLAWSVWEGPFKDGKRHGVWILRYDNGTYIKGPFVDDKEHGVWTTHWPSQDDEYHCYANGEFVRPVSNDSDYCGP